MKKCLFFFIIAMPSTTLYCMLARPFAITPKHPFSRPISSRTQPYIQKTLDFVNNSKNSILDKHRAVTKRLIEDCDSSYQEKETLHIAKRIISPAQPEEQLLHTITDLNDSALLQIGLAHGLVKYIEVKNSLNNTPLYVASVKGYTDLVKTLIDYKANPNSRNFHYDETPLIGIITFLEAPYTLEHISSFYDIITFLKRSGTDIFCRDRFSMTALDYIDDALKELGNQRQRTIKNEDAKLIAIYEKIQKLLQE